MGKKTFEDVMFHGKCDVCGKETNVVVCASSMGAISYSYCKECLQKGLEPYASMVAYISCAGRFPEDINERYQEHCRHILKELNVPEEQFIKDIDKAIQEMNNYFSRCEQFETE